MFKIKKTIEVAISHKLKLPYDSPCQGDHGHNLIITVYCAFNYLNESSMVVDFAEIKRIVHGQLDHKCLNDIEGFGWEMQEVGGRVEFNPTAERLAEWICMQIPKCFQVDVQESTGNIATYVDDVLSM